MRIASLLFVLFWLSLASAQGGGTKGQQQEQKKIPTTLAEAHAELERILSPEELAKIDAMPSEDDMIQYHMPFGTGLRNSWGLWRASPLAKHMQELGFTHPDDMSGVILGTFWCKRHGQDFRLKERAAEYKKYWEGVQKASEEEENHAQLAKATIRNMMMGLRFEKRDVPTVQMPRRTSGLSVRFLCPFRAGVFLTAYCQGRIQNKAVIMGGSYVDPANGQLHSRSEMDDGVARGFYTDSADDELHKMKPGDDFYTLGFYFDPTERKIHRICVKEVNEVYAAVVAGERAWFAGLTNGKAVLAGVGDRDRITVPLPQADEIPDLGLDGQSLLAVYSKTIYRLTDRNWTLVHSGDILLPRSGLPPQRHGNMIFFRDEGIRENWKRLWWLTLEDKLHLSVLDHDVGVVGPKGPRWENSFSYCVTNNGDLWVCVGEGSASKSLLRRSKDGSYSIAIMNNSIRFMGELLGSKGTDQAVPVSAVTALPDDTLLLAGDTGLYRLKGNELVQEIAFTAGKASDSSARVVRNDDWNPNNVLALDDRSYVIGCGLWRGVYLLRKGDDGQWSFLPVDDVRDPVVW